MMTSAGPDVSLMASMNLPVAERCSSDGFMGDLSKLGNV